MNKGKLAILRGLLISFIVSNSCFSQNNPTPGTKSNHTVKGVTFTMVYCPPGSFRMGAPRGEMGENQWQKLDNNGYNEHPHNVRLTKGFWMLETEVAQELYQAVMGTNPSHFKGSKLPVEHVRWYDAVEFCNKLSVATKLTPYYRINNENVTINTNANGFRLPTEAEWEYAARAGTTTPFHYGSRLDSTMANFNGNYPFGGAPKGVYREKTTNVKSFRPNAWGLYDMHGNVWEWCWDWYGQYGDTVDSTGPEEPSRVYRGGSWNYYGLNCRSAFRNYGYPYYRNNFIGFRFARTQ